MINYQTSKDQLQFESGVFPSIVVNEQEFRTLDETRAWLQANQQELETELAQSGALLFRGFPVVDAESFDTFSDAFGYPSFTYQESLSNAVRINFTKRVFTANEAPKDVEIFLHHEMAQTPKSPQKLFFFCKSAADQGGATPLCRSDMLFAGLEAADAELAAKFASLGLLYTTHMPAEDDHASGQGRSWRSTMSAQDITEAEAKLAGMGYTWEWDSNGGLRATTPVLPAVLTLENGTRVFYNQLIAAYLGWQGVRENPSRAITFGDGSAIPREGLDLIVDLAQKYTFDLQWQDGDVALVDNKLTMHGRRPYSGERKREVLVALAA
ncbi:taurine catabolism dioxygenase TauD/TfdA family protein [Arenicella chitinivorans]|uniref:Taurine catabolism dioxygenase TauD/TfdA family protein n=1 Tax=Arenicella chitinivorans TaxID=1329800 RepID=A0A918RM44_9GAMM|nr:TauD/TfdA family dioxygenase [Arenicella chitinivorans]GHA02510.1 taurine catabolism dioxygenase TauD/TfdA family protein [Arenicella chitinivorans]